MTKQLKYNHTHTEEIRPNRGKISNHLLGYIVLTKRRLHMGMKFQRVGGLEKFLDFQEHANYNNRVINQ